MCEEPELLAQLCSSSRISTGRGCCIKCCHASCDRTAAGVGVACAVGNSFELWGRGQQQPGTDQQQFGADDHRPTLEPDCRSGPDGYVLGNGNGNGSPQLSVAEERSQHQRSNWRFL